MSNHVCYKLTLPEDLRQQRLDKVLATHYPMHSRAQLQKWIQAGFVTINGQTASENNCPVKGMDIIEIQAKITPSIALKPIEISLDTNFEDDSLLVIIKSQGLMVHPGEANLSQRWCMPSCPST